MAEVIVQSTIDGVRHRRLFDDVETFCLFIGYPRSGHTLVGALLNAHPEAVVAHELGVMRYVKLGLRRDQLYSLLLARDQQFGEIGHQWSGYDYDIPGQHQGRWDRLRVIGDKRAASATNRLAGRPELLDRLRRTVRVPLRLIHVVRNPFDNIATMTHRRGVERANLSDVSARYARLSGIVEDLRSWTAPEEFLDLRYEEFVERPEQMLREVSGFVGLTVSDDYLRDCAQVVKRPVSRSRDRFIWSVAQRQTVESLIARQSVLTGYAFEDESV